MVGRSAQQKPWIFGQIEEYLATGKQPEEPSDELKQIWLISHIKNLYAFYGEHQGVRIARKHINWQLSQQKNYSIVKPAVMQAETAAQQLRAIEAYFSEYLPDRYDWAS